MTGRPTDSSDLPVDRPQPAMSGDDRMVRDDQMDQMDRIREALQDCLARIEAGAAPAAAIAACPDAELRIHLASLVAPALGLRDLPAIPVDRGEAIRGGLDQLAAELYPAGGPAPLEEHVLPSGRFPVRLITILVIGVGLALVAWFVARGGLSDRPPATEPLPSFSPQDWGAGGADSAARGAGRPTPSPQPPPPKRLGEGESRSFQLDPSALGRGSGPNFVPRARDDFPSSQNSPSPSLFGGGGRGEGVGPRESRGERVGLPAPPNPSSIAEDRAFTPCAAILGTDRGTAGDGAGAAPIPAGSAVRITGRVVDADCRPIPDAIVVMAAPDGGDEFLARTEPDGSYTLTLDPGRYHAEVLAEGYAIRGWFDGGSYVEPQPAAPQAVVDVRAGAADLPLRVDFVLTGPSTGSPTGDSR